MKKITISIQDSSLYFKFRNKKLDDVNLLNTNVISNNELVFSDEYIYKNSNLVNLFIKDLISENNIDSIIISNNSLFGLVTTIINGIDKITTIDLKEETTLSYEICENIIKLGYIKTLKCYQVPTFMIEMLDKENISVESRSEVFFTSNFMLDNDLTSYSKIYYKKTVNIGPEVSNEDIEDFKSFCNINKYLKIIVLEKYDSNIIKLLTKILEDNNKKNISVEIHENIDNEQDIIDLRSLNKDNKKKKAVTISLVYSDDYLEKNYLKQVIFTTLKICSLIIFSIVGGSSAFIVYNYFESDRKVSQIQTELKDVLDDTTEEEPKEDEDIYNPVEAPIINGYDKLLDINSDTVGWITVKNTNIDYPVVKTTDNDYYLNRNYYKEKDPNGWVFMDYRNSYEELDTHTIIYAHNRYYSGVMFGTLNNVTKWKWYSNKDNLTFTFNTLYENHTWEIFSVYSIDVTTDYLYTYFESDNDYKNFLDKISSRSNIRFNTKVSTTDKIITLSTCLNGDRRLVVHAKLIS